MNDVTIILLEEEEIHIKPLLKKALLYENLLYIKFPELKNYPFKIIQSHPLYEFTFTNPKQYDIQQPEKFYRELSEQMMTIILRIDSISCNWNNESRAFRKRVIQHIQVVLDHIERIRILLH